MKVLIVTANNGLPYVEVCMSSIHNHNFSIYFTLSALTKRVLIIFLTEKKTKQSLSFQIFIEPKGKHLIKDETPKYFSCSILFALLGQFYVCESSFF